MRSLPLALLCVVALGCPEERGAEIRLPDGGVVLDSPTVEGEPIPENDDGEKPSGPRHEQYIRSEFYPRLVLEVDFVEGKLPPASVDTAVVEGFATVLSKPQGIVVQHDQALPSRGADHVWTFGELVELAREQFDLEVPTGTIKIHTMILDGSYENPNVLGVAWASKYLVLFKDRLDSACNANLGALTASVCEEALRGVWTHELGHVIGLVNNGVSMKTPHQDEAHGAHDTSTECIMYWAYETPGLLDRILEGKPKLGFDPACLEDLAQVRDR